MDTSTKVNKKKCFSYSFIRLLFTMHIIILVLYNNTRKVDHQIFYLTKWNQKKHLILECLLTNPMNHHHKGEVW